MVFKVVKEKRPIYLHFIDLEGLGPLPNYL